MRGGLRRKSHRKTNLVLYFLSAKYTAMGDRAIRQLLAEWLSPIGELTLIERTCVDLAK